MARFRFQAIDDTARVVRGVLRADDVAQAREFLLEESLYAKTIEEVEDEAKATWSPRSRIKAAAVNSATKQNDSPERIVRASFATKCQRGFEELIPGEIGLNDDNALVFVPKSEVHPPLIMQPADIEVVALAGFPTRRMAVILVSGKTLEFDAGFIFASPHAKFIISTLTKST